LVRPYRHDRGGDFVVEAELRHDPLATVGVHDDDAAGADLGRPLLAQRGEFLAE